MTTRIVSAGLLTGCLLLALLARAELVAPFVVTPQRDVERMMQLADVGPDDYLIDLGSGDGRIVIAAAQRGAAGHGVELDGNLVREATLRAEGAGVADRVAFVEQDLFRSDFSQATVLTMYLMPDVVLRLRPMLLERLAPGTRIISNSFDMGAWRPERHISAAVSGGLYLWIVPARVDGDWHIEFEDGSEGMRLAIDQTFQDIEPSLEAADRGFLMEDVRLHADRIGFRGVHRLGSYLFSGRVNGDEITGTVHIREGDEVRVVGWRARRS